MKTPEEERLKKEIEEKSQLKRYELKISKMDLDNGEVYEIFNQLFETKEGREKEMKRLKEYYPEGEGIECYDYEIKDYENIKGYDVDTLKAQLLGISQGKKIREKEILREIDEFFGSDRMFSTKIQRLKSKIKGK